MNEAHASIIGPRPSTAPRRPPPAGACDCHVHASDGTGRFPIKRKTHPPLHAPWSAQDSMLRATGLERTVPVQLMAYGDDNRALTEILADSGGRARGVAEIPPTASDAEMQRLHEAGVRALRFYFEPPKPLPGIKIDGANISDLKALSPRMKALGWAAEISAGCDLVVSLAQQLQDTGIPIVFEHMAGCRAVRGINDPSVRKVVDLVRDNPFWIKLTICAMSDCFPDYEDLRPIHDAFVAAAPQRMLWGSNWPHAMMGERTPDSGHLLDLFEDWTGGDQTLRQSILSDNPARLFDFPPLAQSADPRSAST